MIRKLYYKSIVKFLSLLGIGSALGICYCDDDIALGYAPPPSSYADYKLSGQVINSEDNAGIQGIKVEYLYEQAYTDSDGFWELIIANGDYPPWDSLTFTDIDGSENSGEFATQDYQPVMQQTDDTQCDTYGYNEYCGTFEESDITIRMEKE